MYIILKGVVVMSKLPQLGAICPNLSGVNARGTTQLADHLGKWVIVCTYNRRPSHPSHERFLKLLELQKELQAKDINLLGIPSDTPYSNYAIIDEAQMVRAILHDAPKLPMPFSNLVNVVENLRTQAHSIQNEPTYNPDCPTLDRIVGEYVLGDPRNVDPELLDFVIYAFATILPDGSFQVYSERHLEQLANLKSVKPSLKVLLAIGGWGAEGFSDAALTPQSRYDFAREALRWVNLYNLDGVDIDWEYPGSGAAGIITRPVDTENFTLLLTALRDVLGPNRWLTVAGTGDTSYINNVQISQIAPLIDYFNIMSYDFTAGSTGANAARHHSNLYTSDLSLPNISADRYVTNLINAGMPSEKLLLGLPFYGRFGATRVSTFDEIRRSYINQDGYTVRWDNTALAPYIVDANNNFFLSYDNPVSIYFKGLYTIDNCLGGMFSWQSTMDQANILADSMYLAVNDPRTLEEILEEFYFLPTPPARE
jgi:GH18 family chitinase/peroxiredoxin